MENRLDRTEMEAKNQFYPTSYDMKIIITYFFTVCVQRNSQISDITTFPK